MSEVALALAQHGAAAAGASGADLAVMDTDTDRMRFVHSAVLDARIAARWADVDTGDHIPPRIDAHGTTGLARLAPSDR